MSLLLPDYIYPWPTRLALINESCKPIKKKKTKNLILLKPLPSVILFGIKYKRPKGTVYKNIDGEWHLIQGDDEDCVIVIEDLKTNKDWYGLTDKPPTNLFIEIGGDSVVFHKDKIEIGCQTVEKKTIKAILKQLNQ